MQGYPCSCGIDEGCKAYNGFALRPNEVCQLAVNDPEPAVEEIDMTAPDPRFKALTVYKDYLVCIDEQGSVYMSCNKHDVDLASANSQVLKLKRLKMEITD